MKSVVRGAWCVVMFAACAVFGQSSNTTSTVTFSLRTLSGTAQNRALVLEAELNPDLDDGANIFWDATFEVHPTNGVATAQLEPNTYTVTMQGVAGDFAITVPTNGESYSALDLTTNLTAYRGASNGPAMVVFPLLTFRGAAQNKPITITALTNNPMRNGTNIVWGAPVEVYPTNGLASKPLEPTGYRVRMGNVPGSMTIWVPTDGGTYNAAALPSVMPTPVFSWSPEDLVSTWTDKNGQTNGDLETFNSIADLASVWEFQPSLSITNLANAFALPALRYLHGMYGGYQMVELDLTGCSQLTNISYATAIPKRLNVSGCTHLTTLHWISGGVLTNIAGFQTCSNITDINVYHAHLGSGEINNILLSLQSFGLSNGTASLNGQLGGGSPPTGDATNSVTTLISRGWSVTTD
ncbi:MAG: hypothetical protein ABFD89_05170 [Bryobacteraceae bacterium]